MQLSRKFAPLMGLAACAALGLAAHPAQAQTVSTSGGVTTYTYGYTGSNQSFTVPTGVSSLFVTLDGGGGTAGRFNPLGGSGALVTGYLGVTPTETFTILVGAGGYRGFDFPFGGGGNTGNGFSDGGGRSAIQNSAGNDIVDAGGGGGGGSGTGPTEIGGNGGYNGVSAPDAPTYGGDGGTQTAGGAGGGDAGTQYNGGDTTEGGGGGGGYYGGGGGYLAGGGGGSSYIDMLTNPSPSDVITGGANNGGNNKVNYGLGGPGAVILSYTTPVAPVPEPSSLTVFAIAGLGLLGLAWTARKRNARA